ncbi:MAG: TIM barrel protein [Nocardioides sp.]
MPEAMDVPPGVVFAANLSTLFTHLPLVARPAAAAAAGFVAVEAWWPFVIATPSDEDVEGFLAAVDAAGVRLVALNCFAGDMPSGDRGVVSMPGRSAEFRASLDRLLRIAERTGCTTFNALYGTRVVGVPAAEQDEIATENLVHAAARVAEVGGTIAIEPLTSGENGTYPILTAQDALVVVGRARSAGAANVSLLADLYHASNNGDDPAELLTRHAGDICHVQVADSPGRHEPGTGSLDFTAIWAALLDIGYAGYVALEYRPLADTVDGLAWLPESRRGHAPHSHHDTRSTT